ncbi:minor capsid protein [Gemella sp. Musashino-2025]
MSIKVSYDFSPLEKKFGANSVENAKTLVANQILIDSDEFVPSDGRGYLRTGGHVTKGSAIWNTVYARAQFFGTNGIVTFRKYTIAGTGKEWTEKAADKHMKDWEEVAKKGLGIR